MSLDSTTQLGRPVIHLSTYNEADGLAAMGAKGLYVKFTSNAVKEYFARRCKQWVINCCSSFSRFAEEMEAYDKDTVFYNASGCSEPRITEIIKYTNNLVID
jgi:hypothetical protein